MDLGLKGLRAVLTGGAHGIGRATMELLTEEGVDVAFLSRKQAMIDEAVAAVADRLGRAFGTALDIRDREGYVAWLKASAERLGGVDIFVHNASSSGAGWLEGEEGWQVGLEVDLLGASRGCETLEPWLAKSRAAAVVLLASTASAEAFIGPLPFNALKAGTVNYGKNLAQVWAPKGIRVNCVSPGPTYHAEHENWQTIIADMPELHQQTLAQIGLGRLGTTQEIARTIVFLASPAASYTTGSTALVDGGFSKRIQF